MSDGEGSLAIDVLVGPGAPPQANGEPVFANPTEARLFGMAHGLVQAGVFDWDTFREALIAAIARAEAGLPPAGEVQPAPTGDAGGAAGTFDYYACFAEALEHLLARAGHLTAQELATRSAALAARPAGHDHVHGPAHARPHGT